MENKDYEQKRRECWEQFLRLGGTEGGRLTAEAFVVAFDRAYAIGRQHPKPDTEEEEMLTVSRKKVQDLFEERQFVYDVNKDRVNRENAGLALLNYAAMLSLVDLFGTKCLPDKVELREDSTMTDCDKTGSDSTKNTFCNEHWLNIAAMAMQGLLSAPVDNNFVIGKSPSDIAEYAARCADALIALAEEQGNT